jgi:flagella basal body P-ring formation protein FlgA
MIRRALISLAFLAAAAPALAGQPVVLKTQPSAGADAVTLGDLFDGASGPAAKVVLAAAPQAGLNTVLDAGKVQLAARGAGLDWDNALGVRRIVVSGAPAPGSAAAAAARPAATRETQALAYARNIMAGEIVGAADLVWSSEAIAPAGAPGDPDAVIGMAARRPLRAGAAVQARDLSAPMVVKRDEVVSVAFESGGISLTLQGKALKDAAVGDSVQVLNTQSKKVIEAVVAGPGKAVVGPRAEAIKARAFGSLVTASLR